MNISHIQRRGVEGELLLHVTDSQHHDIHVTIKSQLKVIKSTNPNLLQVCISSLLPLYHFSHTDIVSSYNQAHLKILLHSFRVIWRVWLWDSQITSLKPTDVLSCLEDKNYSHYFEMDKASLISNRQDTIKVTVHGIKNPVITKCMENMEHYNLKSCIIVSAVHTQHRAQFHGQGPALSLATPKWALHVIS